MRWSPGGSIVDQYCTYNQMNPNLTGFWGPVGPMKFTVSLSEMDGEDLAHAYCAAAPPKGYTTFLGVEMGSTDAKRMARCWLPP